MGINKHVVAPGDELRLFCANPRGYKKLYVVFGIKPAADCPRSFFSWGYWGKTIRFDPNRALGVIVVEVVAGAKYIDVTVPLSAKSGFIGVATPRDMNKRNRVFVNPAKGWLVVKNES